MAAFYKFSWSRPPAETRRALRTLATDVQTKGIKSAVTAGAKPAKERLRDLTPVGDTGALRASIGQKALNERKKGRTGLDAGNHAVLVGPTRKINKKHRGYIGRFLEFGTQHIRARGFIATAEQQSRDQVAEQFYKGLDRFIKRTKKKQQAST